MTTVIVHDPIYREALAPAFPEVAFVDLADLEGPVDDDRVALIIGRPMPADEAWMRVADNAEYVHFTSTGYDEMPPEWLKGRTLTTAKGTNAVPVAEFAVACVLARAKNLPHAWEHGYSAFTAPLGTLEGAKVAVLGYGTVGSRIVGMLRPFTDRISVFRRRGADPLPGLEVTDDIDAALHDAAHVVIALELTDDTRGLLGRDRIARLASGAHVVNVGRAGIVDQEALVDAVRAGSITVSLDVTAPEPLPAEHELRHLDGARISPHVAWSGPQVVPNRLALVAANMRAWLDGGVLSNVVPSALDARR